MGDTALEELNKKNKGTYQLVPSGDGPNDSRVGKGRMSIPLERGIINDTTMEQKLCKALECLVKIELSTPQGTSK